MGTPKEKTTHHPQRKKPIKEIVLDYTEQRAFLNLESCEPLKTSYPICETDRQMQSTFFFFYKTTKKKTNEKNLMKILSTNETLISRKLLHNTVN